MSIAHAAPDAALPVDESFLRALGVHRIAVPVPFPEAGGPANIYVLENPDDTLTLFDCGIRTDEANAALKQGFADRGLERWKIRTIIVSHGHIDHYGNAQELSQETGALVWVHPADLEKVCGDGRWNKQLERSFPYFLHLGVPRETLDQMLDAAGRGKTYAKQVEPSRVKHLFEGQRFEFKHLTVEVLHMPGHTPGLVCLHDAAHKILFADDHVLARVSPNPLLDLTAGGDGPNKFRALSEYMKSAKRVHAMELDCVLPGHGEAFKNHRPLLDGLFAFYDKRQQKLVQKMGEAPATVYELVHVVFPRVEPGRLYLMLSEVLGNLEVLEDAGKIRRIEDGAIFRFALA